MTTPHSRHSTLFLAPVLGVALLVAACDVSVGEGGLSFGIGRGRATDEWTRTYTVSPGGRLEIVNVNGPIEVSPSSGTQIEVWARREVRAGSDETARERLQKLEMMEEVSPDRVRVQARLDRESGFRRGGGVTVEYKIKVPAGLNVSVKTENGGVRLDDVKGQILAATTNGAVMGRGLSGSVDAETVNGAIQIELTSVSGEIRASTTNGAVRLELPTDVKAELDARTVNGGVSVDDRLAFSGDREASGFPGAPKRLSGTINGGGHKISAHTTNGGVRVTTRGARPEA